MSTLAPGTARFTMSGPGVHLDMAIPLPLAEEVLLIMVVERPNKPIAGDSSLRAELERHAPVSELEDVLVVMAWREAQGFSNTTAPEINAALEAAGNPTIRYASAYLTRAAARGECKSVGWGEFQLTESGRQRLAEMRARQSAPTAEDIAARAKAVVVQKEVTQAPVQKHGKRASASAGPAGGRRPRRAKRKPTRPSRAA